MAENYPWWATKKQIEGMRKFTAIAEEYGNFKIEFTQNIWGDENESVFVAVVAWGEEKEGSKKHSFSCGWDYEKTWDYCGERIKEWQFVFGGRDATRGMTSEAFFACLFFYLDNIDHAVQGRGQ